LGGNPEPLAVNEIDIEVPPAHVFAILADPQRYADWVVGAIEVRDADPDWPAEGAELHHTSGARPLTIKDETRVLESVPPRRLVLLAETEPLGSLRVTLELDEPSPGKTHVRMVEEPETGLVDRLPTPIVDWLIRGRNVMSLRLLKQIAESP
jgi:uncharacterized protein YndB with AHSA1/START domain